MFSYKKPKLTNTIKKPLTASKIFITERKKQLAMSQIPSDIKRQWGIKNVNVNGYCPIFVLHVHKQVKNIGTYRRVKKKGTKY